MSRRTFWILVVALCLVAAGLSLWLPREAAARRVSDLYRRYEPNPHLSVAFIEGFKVNDTLSVDVTTVTALDDEGWDTLRHDFSLAEVPPEMLAMFDSNSVFTKYVPKKDYSQPMDRNLINNDIILYSMHKGELCIFQIDFEDQIMAVFEYNVRQSRIKKKNLIN